jgi:hypothetical protein
VLPLKAQLGDKIRVKSGPHSGERGVIEGIDDDKLVIRLEASGQAMSVLPESVTNFSLAARKAWVTGPDRAVGRRKGTKLCDRVSVTLRIDRGLWERFREMERSGLIEDRTAAVNSWLGEKLDVLVRRGRRVDAQAHDH